MRAVRLELAPTQSFSTGKCVIRARGPPDSATFIGGSEKSSFDCNDNLVAESQREVDLFALEDAVAKLAKLDPPPGQNDAYSRLSLRESSAAFAERKATIEFSDKTLV